MDGLRLKQMELMGGVPQALLSQSSCVRKGGAPGPKQDKTTHRMGTKIDLGHCVPWDNAL